MRKLCRKRVHAYGKDIGEALQEEHLWSIGNMGRVGLREDDVSSRRSRFRGGGGSWNGGRNCRSFRTRMICPK